MKNENEKKEKSKFKIKSLLRARCPCCHIGAVTKNFFLLNERCSYCKYSFHPEPGFYLGAMVVGFLFNALAIIPPTIVLKVLKVDINWLIAFPFLEFIFVGTFIFFYARILWLHLEYQITNRLDR